MKIGIESQRIFRTGKHGMDVVAMELIHQLQRIDNSNEYVLFAKDGPDKDDIHETPNFAIHLLKSVTYGDWEQISLPRALRKIKPQLLHCTANTAPVNCPVPLVLTLHDIIFLQDINFQGSAYQNFGNIYRRLVVPSAIKKARRIITVSENEKRAIINKCHVDPEKISVIYNAVSERFNSTYHEYKLTAFKKKYQLPEAFILHLGNTAPKKNTERLIKAYIQYCDLSQDPLPVVFADYPEQLVMRVLETENRGDLIKNFHFTGYVSVFDMPLLYNCASLFIYPSLNESFGLPLLEAMACGVPVITSAIPALQEIGGDAPVYIDPGQTSGIAETITTLLNDSAMIAECRKKGLARASRFNWKTSAEQVLKVYQQVAG